MKRRSFVGACGLFVTAGCLSTPPSGASEDTGAVDAEGEITFKQAVEIVRHEQRVEAGRYYIDGVVENISDRAHEFQVLVTWYDADDVVLGEGFSQVDATVEAGQRRAFDTTRYDASKHGRPARYELELDVD